MDDEQKKVVNIYAMLCGALIMSLVPMATAAGLSLIMFGAVLTAAYVLRGRAQGDSPMAGHMTYIIRTLWISGFFGVATMAIAIIYVLGVYDPSPLEPCASGTMPSEMAEIEAALKPCYDEFMRVNMKYLVTGGLIGAGPVVLYLVYRAAKGLSRALKGHRIGDTKSWF